MATYSKISLQDGTLNNGRGIKVAATSIGSGTTIHTASTTTTTYDEIWLYAQNTDTSNIKLTLGFGGTTDPDDLMELTITAESGLVLVVPGLVLKGAATALVLKAAAATANKITLYGYVNRITA